jgi:hypothetical protein
MSKDAAASSERRVPHACEASSAGRTIRADDSAARSAGHARIESEQPHTPITGARDKNSQIFPIRSTFLLTVIAVGNLQQLTEALRRGCDCRDPCIVGRGNPSCEGGGVAP